MKFSTLIAPILLGATFVAAAKGKGSKGGSSGGEEEEEEPTTTEDSVFASTSTTSFDVGSVISAYYPTQVPTLAPAISTTLASAFVSVESSWYNSPEFTSLDSAIASAAPASLQASISRSGWRYDDIVTADWFTQGVPTRLQSAMKNEYSAIVSVAERITGTATSDNGAMRTGAPIAVAGIVGVVGGVWAAM